jgi:geranylgeranyl diphosphate synthase type II
MAGYISDTDEYPPVIYDAMRYSLFAGGKRVRPILTLLSAKICGLKYIDVMPAACAMEMIHTYSLIHDDLPAMDDDDLRRGKPTSHKKFGEAVAILAGDALLTKAFETALLCGKNKKIKPASVIAAVSEMADGAGVKGMIGGQVVDITSEGKKISNKTLSYLHRCKTGALIRASVVMGALLSGADSKQVSLFRSFGEKIGLAFQIVDDVLDVTSSGTLRA